MRLSRWLAAATKLSRRKADEAIEAGRVKVDGQPAEIGQRIDGDEQVELDDQEVIDKQTKVVLLNKPYGYVCTKNPQDEKPIVYELLPKNLKHLAYAGRLDADSEGLVIMTNDGKLIQQLTHPKFEVERKYRVELDKPLDPKHAQELVERGVNLGDGNSKFDNLTDDNGDIYVKLHEGRNRQIRRSFEHLGYQVQTLRRLSHGQYSLGDIEPGEYRIIDISP